ncbi:hypothetical protein [Peribacillus cavernae]|nr:hypothetical protein [Peribacillus cavernae]MDQ0218239.1 hypothetical protein [Peribacillus cavernae]
MTRYMGTDHLSGQFPIYMNATESKTRDASFPSGNITCKEITYQKDAS